MTDKLNKKPNCFCPNCGGLIYGYIGFPGEYPCECAERIRRLDRLVSDDIERRRIERKENAHE